MRASVLDSETSHLWPVKAAVGRSWIGLKKGVVFQGSNWVVQTQNETLFIYLHSCAGLESFAEMTQFLIFDMLTNGQFINRERKFGNNILFRTIAYVLHDGGQNSNSP